MKLSKWRQAVKRTMMYLLCLFLFGIIVDLHFRILGLEIVIGELAVQTHIIQQKIQKTKCVACHRQKPPTLQHRI